MAAREGVRPAWLVALGSLGVLFSLPLWASSYVVGLFQVIFGHVALASAWALFSGLSGYFSLGSAAFFGVGTYAAFLLTPVVGWIPSIFLGTVMGGLVALAVGGVSLRLKGPYFAILTFGLSELIRYLVLGYEMRFSRTVGRVLILPVDVGGVYLAVLTVAVAAVGLSKWLYGSRYGRLLAAIGADEGRLESLGFRTTGLKVAMFAVSGGISAAVGAALAPRWTYIDPHIAFSPLISFQTVLMAMLGGTTRWWGPLVGALSLGLVSEFLSLRFRYLYLILLGLLLIALVRFWPRGLVEVEERIRQWRTRRLPVEEERRAELRPGWGAEPDP
ncbi:MAG: branched-chain amino acid ABC transporter permease [Armatimonadetes bacterium]|nr:branched-chain amino acid ABC transporter permease [Armatimonadota bacterium]MDW8153906.1 branched-chain amino acid ABC transporter permease [Armatimonadota bacterium]